MRKLFCFFLITFLLLTFLITPFFSESRKYSYDYSNPQSIVNSACLMLMYADYPEMLNLTEMMEKKRTLATIEETTNAKIKELLIKESEKIIKFEIIGTEDFTNNSTNQLMVITVKWAMKIDPSRYVENNPRKAIDLKESKSESVIYTDYLLKKFEDKWKIISKKSK